MKVGFRTLLRAISTLVIVLMLVAGASMEAAAKGQRGRGRRGDDNGRHLGWTRGRHRGWEHSRSRHVRDDDRWDGRRNRRRSRRLARRERRLERWETRRDRRSDRRDWRRLRRNRRLAVHRHY